MWVATSGGLSRYQNGRFTSLTKANAPLVDLVPVLVEDDEGYIWVGVNTGVGVIRFHPRELDRMASNPAYHIEYALYDETDGLQQAPLTWQSGVGAVRAPTAGCGSRPGLASPSSIRGTCRAAAGRRRRGSRRLPWTGGRRRSGPDLALPARTATLRIQYGAVSLSSGVEAPLPLSARGPRPRLGLRGPAPRGHLRESAVQHAIASGSAPRTTGSGPRRASGVSRWRRRSTARAGSSSWRPSG